MKNLMLIVNPAAGRSGYRYNFPEALQLLDRGGYRTTLYFTAARGEATDFARKNGERYDVVACIGGDGTLSEVITGLMALEKRPRLAYIPMGTANDVATTLNLPKNDSLAAARRILEGEKPAVTEGQYPNRDPAFFENLINASGEVYAVTADGFTNSPGRIGFQDLLRKDVAANWMQGDLSILSAVPADLNADGQLEYWIAASDGSSEVRIILHEQDGIVYAYLLNYTDGYELDADGNIVCSSPYYSFRFRLIFDREQAFLLSLPD